MSKARFAHALSTARVARGFSQAEMAHRCGLDHSFVSRLEAGKRTPSRETVAALCAVLDSTWAEQCQLFTAADYLPPGDWVAVDGWLIKCEGKEEATA